MSFEDKYPSLFFILEEQHRHNLVQPFGGAEAAELVRVKADLAAAESKAADAMDAFASLAATLDEMAADYANSSNGHRDGHDVCRFLSAALDMHLAVFEEKSTDEVSQ